MQLGIPTPNAPSLTLWAAPRVTDDGRYRYTYTPGGQVHEVRNPQDQLIARYTYNSLHQRVSKTVLDGANSTTTHFLWSQGKLVAEMDAQGHITSQYLYLSEGQRATPFAKLESAQGAEHSYFIHTDHRGAPLAMTDEDQHMVWQAEISPFGVMSTASSKNQNQQNQTTLNLRLAGQYFDAETGLHDNWHRSYNPHTGRYLQPDPLGYPDGPDAYLYAQGDPVNKSDPMGLYQIDIHYYMTYFLARTAGLSDKEALTVALGAQYIDDNPFTWPLDPNAIKWSYLTDPVGAATRLGSYHFTQSGSDSQRIERWYVPTAEERAAAINAGYPPLPPYISEPDDVYAARRIQNPDNPQLRNLLGAANKNLQTSSNPLGMPPCTRAQLFGEYLHAFEDTFGHRNKSNEPIDVNLGLGHAIYGEQPDYTYNDSVYLTKYPGAIGTWDMREARTLEMEKEVFAKIQSQFGKQGKDKGGFPIAFSDIQATLKAFNALHENEDTGFRNKLDLLKQKLAEFGLGTIPDYVVTDACTNRQNNLKPIIDLGERAAKSQYPGVILGTPSHCPTERGQLTE